MYENMCGICKCMYMHVCRTLLLAADTLVCMYVHVYACVCMHASSGSSRCDMYVHVHVYICMLGYIHAFM